MRCPKCMSDNIHFTEKQLRGNFLIAMILELLFIIITIVLFINQIYVVAIIFLLTAIIYPPLFKVYDLWKRRRSKTKAICNDCGHSWYTKY